MFSTVFDNTEKLKKEFGCQTGDLTETTTYSKFSEKCVLISETESIWILQCH